MNLPPELEETIKRIGERPRRPAVAEEVCAFCSNGGWVTWVSEENEPQSSGPCPRCRLGMAAMNVPALFRDAELSRDFPRFTEMQEWDGSPPGWYIYGPVGAGKSHLAAALCRQAVKWSHRARFIHTAEYLELLRKGIDDQEANLSARDLTEQLARTDVVALDDLGGEHLSDWAQEQLLLLVNRLYNRQTALVVTSNFDWSSMATRLGDRAASRIAGLTKPLEFRGSDRRRVVGG